MNRARRKRKENKEIAVRTKKKPLGEIQKINLKNLEIINENKLNIRGHIMYIWGNCTKLILLHQSLQDRVGGLATKLCIPDTKEQFYRFGCTARLYGLIHWQRMQQNSIQQITAPHKRNNKRSFSKNIQQSSLHFDRETAIEIKARKRLHYKTTWDKVNSTRSITKHSQKPGLRQQTQSKSLNNKINPLYIIRRRQQERARSWSWNSNIYPEQFSAPIKVYATQ